MSIYIALVVSTNKLKLSHLCSPPYYSDPNLLAENFLYLEKLIGPLDKEQYLKKFGEEYDLKDGMPDLDLRLTNFR